MHSRLQVAVLALTAGAAISWTWGTVDPRLDERLAGRTRVAVVAMVDSAEREKLQTEPLIDLALEASMKRARQDMIVQSVRQLLQHMRRAKTALGGESTPDEVTAAAKALKAGVDIRHIERLRTARTGQQRFASALNALTYIVAQGVPSDTAATVFVNLALASATDAQISSLQRDIDRDIAGGTPAGLAATVRGDGLERVIAAQGNLGGAPGSTLPSARGTTRAADPSATGPVAGGAAGNTVPGAPGGRGKPVKRP